MREQRLAQVQVHQSVSMLVQVAVEDIIADGRLRLAVTPVFDETQLAAALQVSSPSLSHDACLCFLPRLDTVNGRQSP